MLSTFKLVGEDQAGNWSREIDYIWMGRRLLGTETGPGGPNATVKHYHTDHLGSIRLVTDSAGNKVSEHEYLPYGQELTSAGNGVMKFTGHERDSDTGMDYMHARFYTSYLGRFMSVDPVLGSVGGPGQRWNRYSYVLGRPMGLLDPTGESPCKTDDCITVVSSTTSQEEFTVRATADAVPWDILSLLGVLRDTVYDAFSSHPILKSVLPIREARPSAEECSGMIDGQVGSLVYANMQATRGMSLEEVLDKVRSKGDWDYKNLSDGLEELGNFNAGAVGVAWVAYNFGNGQLIGLTAGDKLTEQAAGAYQLAQHLDEIRLGRGTDRERAMALLIGKVSHGQVPGGFFPYGENLDDAADVKKGRDAAIEAIKAGCR